MNYYLNALKKYAVFNGRAQRAEFWYFVLFNYLIIVVLGMFLHIVIRDSAYIISLIYILAMFVPGIAVSIRRLHDTGKSAWWLLIILIPIIGQIWFIVLMATDSNPGENLYGPNQNIIIDQIQDIKIPASTSPQLLKANLWRDVSTKSPSLREAFILFSGYFFIGAVVPFTLYILFPGFFGLIFALTIPQGGISPNLKSFINIYTNLVVILPCLGIAAVSLASRKYKIGFFLIEFILSVILLISLYFVLNISKYFGLSGVTLPLVLQILHIFIVSKIIISVYNTQKQELSFNPVTSRVLFWDWPTGVKVVIVYLVIRYLMVIFFAMYLLVTSGAINTIKSAPSQSSQNVITENSSSTINRKFLDSSSGSSTSPKISLKKSDALYTNSVIADWQTYINNKYRFSLEYPLKYKLLDINPIENFLERAAVITIENPSEPADMSYNPYINIEMIRQPFTYKGEVLPITFSAKEFANFYYQDYKLISQKELNINNSSAYEIVYFDPYNSSGNVKNTVLVREGIVYRITQSPTEYPLFNEIVQTFKFID